MINTSMYSTYSKWTWVLQLWAHPLPAKTLQRVRSSVSRWRGSRTNEPDIEPQPGRWLVDFLWVTLRRLEIVVAGERCEIGVNLEQKKRDNRLVTLYTHKN